MITTLYRREGRSGREKSEYRTERKTWSPVDLNSISGVETGVVSGLFLVVRVQLGLGNLRLGVY